jgi:hypothetical protein
VKKLERLKLVTAFTLQQLRTARGMTDLDVARNMQAVLPQRYSLKFLEQLVREVQAIRGSRRPEVDVYAYMAYAMGADPCAMLRDIVDRVDGRPRRLRRGVTEE